MAIPFLHNRINKDTYNYILEKINQKLSVWNNNFLSFAGRLILVKSVLMTIPTYTMQTTTLPKVLCDKIEPVVQNFVWGNVNGNRNINLAS